MGYLRYVKVQKSNINNNNDDDDDDNNTLTKDNLKTDITKVDHPQSLFREEPSLASLHTFANMAGKPLAYGIFSLK